MFVRWCEQILSQREADDCASTRQADSRKSRAKPLWKRAGVGYDVAISVPTFTALPSVGAEASLHIHTQVSEDQIALFGFLDRSGEAAL